MLIALAVRAGWTAGVDRTLLLALVPPPALVWLPRGFTLMGNTVPRIAITAAVAVLLLALRRWRQAIALVGVVATGAALDSGIKLLVMRPRPTLLPHLDHVTSASFPSGHAANGTMMYLSLALLVPARWRRPAAVAAALLMGAIGLSRIALAVHWPSDVLAGWCVGAGWVLLWRPWLLPPQPVDLR